MKIARRRFLEAASAGLLYGHTANALGLNFGIPKVPAVSEFLSQTLPRPDSTTHLLNRISFGITEQDISLARAMGVGPYLELQLNPAQIDDALLEAELAYFYEGLLLPERGPIAWYGRTGNAARDLRGGTLLRQVKSRRQLFEVMVDFWTNHFNIYVYASQKISNYKVLDDRDVIRANALGYFSDMLHASAHSPAMLMFLDNDHNIYSSTSDRINENYARELLELHTLGADQEYGEDDVRAVARCFSGWGLNSSLAEFMFRAKHHDNEPKVVLGHIIHNPDDGYRDGLEVLQLLAERRSTALYISRKLAQRFISDNPPDSIVNTLADVYLQSSPKKGDIKEMLRTLFASSEFAESADLKLKKPINYLASLLRTLEPELKFGDQGYWGQLLKPMGEIPMSWPTPDGYPLRSHYWNNANGLLHRWNLAFQLGGGGVNRMKVDTDSFIGSARSAEQLVDSLAERVLRRSLWEVDRNLLLDYVAEGGDASAELSDSALRNKVPGLLSLMLASPYLQMQ